MKKEIYASLLPTYKRLTYIVLCLFLVSSFNHAQSIDDCIIRTDIEPDFTTTSYLSINAFSLSNTVDNIDWQNENGAISIDDNVAQVSLLPGEQSQAIKLQGFFADIPLGSEIHSVQIRLTGSSTDNNILQENQVQFILGESPLGKNMAGKSNISSPWKSDQHAWNYGHVFSDIGIDWTRELLTSPELAVQIQIQNTSTTDTLSAEIDQLEILVNYTPLYQLCSNDCVVIYNDEVPGATEYIWSVPEGVKFLNNDPQHDVVNLDFSNAEMGILDIFLDIVIGSDTISCARQVLHIDCSEAYVGDYVWFDENYDGIQDDSDFGLSGAVLKLLNPSGIELQSTTTDNNGNYHFAGLEKGFYKIQLENNALLPSPQNATNSDQDSDLQEDFTSGIFYLNGGDSIANIDFGVYEVSSISGNIWLECDGNGIKNSDENYEENVTVSLLQNGEIVATSLTDVNGAYIFDNLYPGNYTVNLETDIPVSAVNNTTNNISTNVFLANKSIDISLGLAEDKTDIDGAIDPLSFLEVMVYLDENNNETMDVGEDIFDGKSVRIYEDDIMLDEAIVTDGHVQFSNLDSEWYTLKVAEEENYELLSNTIYQTEIIDNMIEVSGFTIDCTEPNMIQLNFKQTNAKIGDFVWSDDNRNGIQDADEQGISGVSVELVDFTTGNVYDLTVTDENGYYEFVDLVTGNYQLEFFIDEDHTSTLSDVSPETGSKLRTEGTKHYIGPFEFIEGQNQLDLDAGVVERLSTISDQVWIDKNRNGKYDTEDPGLSGVVVQLYSEEGALLEETKTNEDGQYSFLVEQGAYYLSFTHSVYVDFIDYDTSIEEELNSDVNPALGNRTDVFSIGINEVRTDIDAGYLPRTAFIGDFIFLDLNEDGFQDDDEIGLSNFTVEAFNLAGELSASTVSEVGGFYQLEVNPGTYYLKFSKSGFNTVSPNISSNQEKNSDITNSFGPSTTELITVEAFEVRNDIDAGFFTVNTLIGDYIWQDVNTNGIQDSEEIGASSLLVNLIKIGEGVIESVYSGNGIDKERGFYSFTVNQPGDYYIQYVLPDNSWSFTEANVMDDELDSDVSFENGFGTTATFFVEPGEDQLNIDAGVIGTSALVGDFVWSDKNNNGLQDADEEGVNGMNVFLYDEYFNFIDVTITTYNTATQQDGYYEFVDLDAGNYILVFDTEDSFVNAFIGDDNSKDSDVTSQFVKGSTGVITLDENEKTFHIDAGILDPNAPTSAIIGDLVWDDLNKNGIYDMSEPGIGNVILELLDENGNLVAETESDASGNYIFLDVPVGNYKLYAELPDDYEFTIPNNSFDDNTDSDIQSSGETLVFSVAGGEIIDHIDVGLIKLPGVSEEIHGENITASDDEETGVNPGNGVDNIENPVNNSIEKAVLHQFQVYPNPARSYANLQFEVKKPTTIKVELISPQGVILQELVDPHLRELGKYTEYFTLWDYKPGTYYMRMTTDYQTYFKKFIIQ